MCHKKLCIVGLIDLTSKLQKLQSVYQIMPPYSPERNPIEMLWREMKYTWMDLNVLDSFERFYKHIQDMLNFFGSKYDINFCQALTILTLISYNFAKRNK